MVEVSPDSILSGTLPRYGASAVARTSDRGRVAEVYAMRQLKFDANWKAELCLQLPLYSIQNL